MKAVLTWLLLAPALTGATFDPKDYGAKGDNATNDMAAFRETTAAINAAGGGTLAIRGPATYLVRTGDVTTLDRIAGFANYAVLAFTVNDVRVTCDPGVRVRIVADFIPQSPIDAATPFISLFGWSGNLVERHSLEGGTWTWEPGAASLLQDTDLINGTSVNRWQIVNGNAVGVTWRDATFSGFPQGGQNGGTKVNGEQYDDWLLDHCVFSGWGGGCHDNLFYVEGRTTFRDCQFLDPRPAHSHAIYLGADRPGLLVDGCYFREQTVSRGDIIHVYGDAGTSIRDVTLTNTSFDNCNNVLLGWPSLPMQHVACDNLLFRNDVCGAGELQIKSGNNVSLRGIVGAQIAVTRTSNLSITGCHNCALAVAQDTQPSSKISVSGSSLTRYPNGSGSPLAIYSASHVTVSGCVLAGQGNNYAAVVDGPTTDHVTVTVNTLAGASAINNKISVNGTGTYPTIAIGPNN